MSTLGKVVTFLLTLVIGYWLIQMAYGIVLWIVYALVPAAIFIGILYILYTTVGRRIISGGRGTLP